MPGSKVWSVVKANAYGHGLESTLKGLSLTDGFALLDLVEAKILREKGWMGPILLLEGLFAQEDIFTATDLQCDCVVHDFNQIDWLEDFSEARSSKRLPNIYLKMNTTLRQTHS